MLVPRANLTLRRVPDGMSDDAALFAGDVMGTGYHAVVSGGVRPGDTVVVLGLGPVGLCAAQAARASGAAQVIAVDSVRSASVAREFFGPAVHLTEEDPRASVKEATEAAARTSWWTPSPDVLDTACRMARKAELSRSSASTRSAARCTWASCGSRRSRSAPGTRT